MSDYASLTQDQRQTTIAYLDQTDESLANTAAIGNEARNANRVLYGAPAGESQTSIYLPTYVIGPVHQAQGNTTVYRHQHSTYGNPVDDTVYTSSTIPQELKQPSGFQSIAGDSPAAEAPFASPGLSQITQGGVPVSRGHTVSQTGNGSYGAAGDQGSTIAPPGHSTYTYSLSEGMSL